jgi:ATP-dependent helicase/nuclease subunit A
VWAGPKAGDVAPVGAARERLRKEAEDEYRRLLYVGMTRAIERLVVCGAEGERGLPEGCWWNLVSNALQPLATEEAAEDGDGKVWRYRKVPALAAPQITAHEPAQTIESRPAWLDCEAPAEPRRELRLPPSHAYQADVLARVPRFGGREERDKATARGVLIHRLLQALPDIAREARAEAAQRHLTRRARGFSAEECAGIIDLVLRLLDEPRFAELFARGSRAELPIVGRIQCKEQTFSVAGQVDRLAVTADSVLIADFKTDQPAPRQLDEVPTAYIAQLALYRAVLSEIYPQKAVRAALIWTQIPELMEIPAARLECALATVTTA